ncbi:uncharacterized protein [Dermacentor albipictus]|uniref:uncharacterized protein n=1 Tax=Dermacentor albipictus TaxID=60249 RepID=UPI0031FDBD7D
MAAANDLDNGTKPWPVKDLICHVRVVIPDITEDVLYSLLVYIESAGVTSAADVNKIEGGKLSAIVGAENAIALLNYFRKADLTRKNPPRPATMSPTAVATQPYAAAAGGGSSQEMVQVPTAAPTQPDAGAAGGGSSHEMVQVFKMAMAMQQHGNEQNQQLMERMHTMQSNMMGSMAATLSETSSTVKNAMETVTKQVTEQAERHRETIAAMQETTVSATNMNREAIRAMRENMVETRMMNSEANELVRSGIADMREEQRRSAEREERASQPPPKEECVIQ